MKDKADYAKRHGSLPLDAEFRTFQAKSAGEVVRGLQEHAAKLRGKPLARSVNGSPPGLQAFVVRPHMDHYSCEIGMGAPGSEWSGVPTKKLTSSAAFVYKCTDMAGRGIAGTADGHSWAYVNEKNAIHLCRYWIGESYAFGHCFMAPSRHQWCYTKEKGTHWYQAKPRTTRISINSCARTPRSSMATRPWQVSACCLTTRPGGRESRMRALPPPRCWRRTRFRFALVAAGDELLDLRLDLAKLAKFRKLVIPTGAKLDPEQQKVLEQVPPDKRIEWKDCCLAACRLEPALAVDGTTGVWALPRRNPRLPKLPLVVHLLNRNYDFAADRTAPQQNLTLAPPLVAWAARNSRTNAPSLRPGCEPASLVVDTVERVTGAATKIPELKLWSVLRFE